MKPLTIVSFRSNPTTARSLLSLAFLILTLPSLSRADDGYSASGLFPPFQYPKYETTVYGARVSPGFVRHKKMYGIDMALVGNITDDVFAGIALAGGFNVTRGFALNLLTQMAGITNTNFGDAYTIGIQIALGYNYGDKNNRVYGAQMAFLGNFGGGNKIYGAQFGLVNYAQAVYGFQIGVINRTKNLHGIQVGVLNFSEKGGLPVFPGINIGF